MDGHFKTISFLGKRDVKAPDFAFAPNAEKLGISFNHKTSEGPLKTEKALRIVSEEKIGIRQPLNSLTFING